MSAWLWLAALLAVLVAALGAALASPIELRLHARYPAQSPVQADVRWLFGLVDVKGLGPSSDEDEEPQPEQEREPEPVEEEPEDEEGGAVEQALDSGVSYLETRQDVEEQIEVALAVVRTEDLPLVTMRLLRDLVAAVHVHRIGLHASFGLGGPAETGKLFGQLQAALAWTGAVEGIEVHLDPEFYGEEFAAGAHVDVEARTWELVRPAIVFALAPPTIRAIKNARRARA